MAHSPRHLDEQTLRAWLEMNLPGDVTADVEQHLEECEACAEQLQQLENPTRKFEDRLRAICEDTPPVPPAPNPLHLTDGRQLAEDTVRTIVLVWEDACAEAAGPTQTVKAASPAPTSKVNLAISPRKVRALEDVSEDEACDYDLIHALGEGGMGIVYSARQSSMDRIVAVKMLRDENSKSPRRELFLQEAVITADLDHPNIVPVHELGRNKDGALFYSMKQVQGSCWADVIDTNSEAENLGVLLHVADAVAFAHSRGIVHRDLKPENVMLGRFGEVWLMDWGLALPTVMYRKAPLANLGDRVGGTPAYMAPEMATSEGVVGPASDIYLLGAILFQIVTGQPPHAGKSVFRCVMAAARNEIIPTDENSGLLEIAYKAMSTSPEQRYESVERFQGAIRRWMSHSESLAIAEKAEQRLSVAKQKSDYEEFVRAVFGFEEAHTLYPENPRLAQSLTDAKFAYAKCAAAKEDLDLAASLLDPAIAEQARLLANVQARKREEELRRRRFEQQRVAFRYLLGVFLLLSLGGVGVTFWLRSSALALANTNEPAMHASLSLQSGLRRSFSRLRDWVALGDSNQKRDRLIAWSDEIRPALEELQTLTANSSQREDQKQLALLKADLDELFEHQWWIEEVAQTPGNEPATDLLLRDIAPVERALEAALAGVVELEAERNDRANDAFWAELAELQMEFAACHRRLLDFVDKGDAASRASFETMLEQFESGLRDLAGREARLEARQQRLVVWLQRETPVYRRLAEEAVTRRESEFANIAEWRLRKQAIPTSQRIEQRLADIVSRYRNETQANSQQINRISMVAIALGVVLSSGAVFAGWFIFLRDYRAAPAALLSLAILLGSPSLAARGQEPKASEEVQPPDVFARVSMLRKDLELIRLEMGKPPTPPAPISVQGAAPHEVYFQALTLFQKTDQLCFEQIRSRQPAPKPPTGEIRPADVLKVVEAVQLRLTGLKKELNIDEAAAQVEQDPARTPTDVFLAIVQANRQLNQLVAKQFSPSDVYQQVTLAVSYSSALLSVFPNAERLPTQPEWERRKTPADVYRRLLGCFSRLRTVAKTSNVQILSLEVSERQINSARPSDVYDIASLLVSELAHLHSFMATCRQPSGSSRQGRFFPRMSTNALACLKHKSSSSSRESQSKKTGWPPSPSAKIAIRVAPLSRDRPMKTPLRFVPVFLLATLIVVPAQAQEFDLVIRNGRVIDPEKMFDAVCNVGVKGGKIAAITTSDLHGKKTIDATGHVVTAGFIDTHFHSLDLFAVKLAMRDGVTTGMDLEYGAWPIGKWYAAKRNNWPINFGTTVSQELVRMSVHDAEDGIDFSVPVDAATAVTKARALSVKDGVEGWSVTRSSTKKMNQITRKLDEGLREGALGVGSTIGYMRKGITTYEMFEAQRAAARYGRLTAVHHRFHPSASTPTESPLGFAEVFTNAVLLKAPLLIAHDNDYGWWEIEEKLRMARAQGLNMWAEYYPYTAGSGNIASEMLQPKNWEASMGYKYEETIFDPTQDRFLTKPQFLKLVQDDPGRTVVVFSPPRKEWLPMWLKVPHMVVAGDGMYSTDVEGKPLGWDDDFEDYAGHPRTAGTHARVLRLGRENNVPLMFSLAQLSYWHAKHLGDAGIEGMRVRGRMQTGMVADIVVFDPDKVTDNAGYQRGASGKPSTGIPYVVVNGTIVVDDSKAQRVMAGQPIRFPVEAQGRFVPATKEMWLKSITIDSGGVRPQTAPKPKSEAAAKAGKPTRPVSRLDASDRHWWGDGRVDGASGYCCEFHRLQARFSQRQTTP